VELGASRRARVMFSYSSYVEMVLSLQVLCEPSQHGVLLPWFMRFKEKISPEAYDQISEYGEALGGWMASISPVVGRDDITDLSVPAVLHELERRPDRAFPAGLSGRRDRWASFLQFLWSYWTEYFHEEFYWIEPLLAGNIRQRTGDVRKDGDGFIRTALPDIADGLEQASGRGALIRLLPSIFTVEERIVGETERGCTACYPVAPGIYRRPESLTPPEPLARLLKSLADDTRLKLLKLMLEEHKCTKDLADELGLAEPTVSRHLRRLRDAELVEGVAEGNYIYYTAKLERIAELHMKVLDFLRS